MLFRRLRENNERTSFILAVEVYAASVLAHVLIIGGTLYAARGMGSFQIADSFTPVTFLIPKDRIQGTRPIQERISFASLEAKGGGEIEVPRPKSAVPKSAQEEAGPGVDETSSEVSPPAQEAESPGDSVMTVLQVDTAVARYEDSAAPPYPATMLAKRVEGTVAIQYIVDTTGYADTSSVVVLSATHPDFAISVRNTLPVMHFRPAVMNARKVRQLVQQLFSFKIDTAMLAQQRKNAKP